MRRVGNYKEKTCKVCSGSFKPTGGKQFACAKCAHVYWKQKHAEQCRRRSRQRKLDGIEYLGGKCVDCGGVYHPAIYEFHHLDPSIKDSDGSDFVQRRKETMLKELDKCVLLCANCHRMRHHKWA